MKSVMPCLLAAMAMVGSSAFADLVIEVDAGKHDRVDTPIRVELPKDSGGISHYYNLEALETHKLVAGETRPGELIWKLEAPLPAGSKRRYRLTKIPTPDTRQDLLPTVIHNPFAFKTAGSHFQFAGGPEVIPLKLDGQTILAYHKTVTKPPDGIDPLYQRSGFIHPLATRSGLVLTDDFPPDHAHQHGLFFAWVNTTFDGRKVDFWNQHTKTGRVGNVPGDETFNGGAFLAEFHASLRHDDLTAPGGPVPVLLEDWDVDAYNVPGCIVIDFESEMKCAGDKPLKLNKHIYGGLGYRGNRQWGDPTAKGNDPPDPAKSGHSDFLTSEGKRRSDGNHTRPRWADLSGEVDGKVGGLTILDHPGNFRYPQPVRLHPNMPYLSFAPEVLGEFEIVPGQNYVSRYRLILHDGPPDPKLIERIWNDYAEPPTVRIISEDK
jgi:Methane oxygenase PmoA